MKSISRLLILLLAFASLAQVFANSKSEDINPKFREGNDKPGV